MGGAAGPLLPRTGGGQGSAPSDSWGLRQPTLRGTALSQPPSSGVSGHPQPGPTPGCLQNCRM